MILTGREKLDEFKKAHSDVRSQVDSWEREVAKATWKTPLEVLRRYPKADIVNGKNAVFDFGWNKYRLWVQIAYNTGVVLVKKIGTHKEYDKWIII